MSQRPNLRSNGKKALVQKRDGIGVRKEKSLHGSLIEWYAQRGDAFEVKLDGFIVDIVRGDLLIEVQTRNLAVLKTKLRRLLSSHRVRLVHPIATQKWILHVTRKGQVRTRRRSPKRGRLEDLFEELVSIPDLITHPNFELEIAMVEEEEVRRADGRGSWRRKGVSILDRRLIRVLETVRFTCPKDFSRFVPDRLEEPFTNRLLAERTHTPVYAVRRITYCLRKMGAIRTVGKKGNELWFQMATEVEE